MNRSAPAPLRVSIALGLVPLLGFTLAACRSDPEAEAEVSAPGAERTLAAHEVVRGGTGGVAERCVRVARTREELADLWAELYGLQSPVPPVPDVDLETSMVVAVFMGTRPSGGYGIEIAGVAARTATPDAPAEVLVRVRETRPGEGDAVTMAMTAPFHLVVVERAEGAARLDAR
ncbi:MAG: protease complex subunit PrcB family protein [Planctomycetota bacterium]